MSNQASEIFQATSTLHINQRNTAFTALVNSTVHKVQSSVQVSLFVVLHPAANAQVDWIGTNSTKAEFEATLLVFTKQDILYFVLGLIGIKFLEFVKFVVAVE